ncbi:Rv3235 family protein [Krasilnikoviella flava]|uniref:Uncharacterized protein n=1 Tax=Krasilnikoviella flava TaxID=526729 RepID=A0A1T5I9N0_9MICO|nr:Rv3235 family protein [Krasilnikoviella flava]SKC35642.1 hypothetical protein SAMN04324258_0178 [Krasilnikoviella flava]
MTATTTAPTAPAPVAPPAAGTLATAPGPAPAPTAARSGGSTPPGAATGHDGTPAPGGTAAPGHALPADAPGTPTDRHEDAAPARSEDDATPARPAPRVSAPPRPAGPAGYPEASTRPAPRARRVRVGAPGTRRPRVDDADVPARPLQEVSPAPLPDPTAQCCTVVRAALEVLRGERPAAQLARWVTPQVRDQLAERARIGLAHDLLRDADHHRPVQVRRVRLIRVGEDVAEATVVLDDDGRVRAAAVRMEARRGAWRVAVLEIG